MTEVVVGVLRCISVELTGISRGNEAVVGVSSVRRGNKKEPSEWQGRGTWRRDIYENISKLPPCVMLGRAYSLARHLAIIVALGVSVLESNMPAEQQNVTNLLHRA